MRPQGAETTTEHPHFLIIHFKKDMSKLKKGKKMLLFVSATTRDVSVHLRMVPKLDRKK